MEKYVQQLLADIESATEHVAVPWIEKETYDLFEWKSEKEDRRTAPRKSLEEWTGIKREALPPAEKLTDDQLHRLVEALKTMLQEYNCIVVFQIQVPDLYQYRVIRDQFYQESSFLQWHMNFFEFCEPGREHKTCTLEEYCHCHFFEELFGQFEEEEEDITDHVDPYEIHLRRKYGRKWWLYDPRRFWDEEEDEW